MNQVDAFVRLVRLLDSPAEVRVLQPLITREIIYRLLVGLQGAQKGSACLYTLPGSKHLAMIACAPDYVAVL